MDDKDKFTSTVRVTTKCSVRCVHCGDVRYEIDMPLDQFVAKAGLMSWRYVDSKKLRRAGPMCAECAEMPDEQRERS